MLDPRDDYLKSKTIERQFIFEWKPKKNGRNSIKIDAKFSIPSYLCSDEHLAVLCAKYDVPIYVRDELKRSLVDFLEKETLQFHDDEATAAISEFEHRWTKNGNKFDEHSKQRLLKTSTPRETVSNEDVFREAYQSLLKADLIYVRELLKRESEFARDMQNLIKERDWEVERLKKEHCTMIEKVVSEMGSTYSEQQVNRMAAEHFERLHMTESNYASQISSLAADQKRSYRELVLRLNEDSLLGKTRFGDSFLKESSEERPRDVDNRDQRGNARQRAETAARLEESFTIHLGAQQKTMHNLRLISMDPIDLCLQKTKSLEESRQLQMALSLYSGQLHGVVLLVDSKATYHVNFRTDFARACEQSTELHFPELESQLTDISNHVVRANECRYLRAIAAQSENTGNAPSSEDAGSFGSGDNPMLKPGDVYMTRHSNLSQVHVVFHLVVDDILQTQEINSRHPCINGLRNIIRLCYKFDITTISLPLLLLKNMTEELTVSWCVKRAELVFKCVKGFMMECATLSGANEQYTVQFLVPPDVSADVFHQLSDMLLSIFHLAKPVVVVLASSSK